MNSEHNQIQKKPSYNKIFIGLIVSVFLVSLCYFGFRKNDTELMDVNPKSGESVSHESGELKNGDIIFQTSLSGQSKAIQIATGSKYSHCGIIFIENGHSFVFEAIQPVQLTPLEKWIARGESGHFVVKRLVEANNILNGETLTKMKRVGEELKGKDYDFTFEWSDDKIYCSELVWKVYKRATGIEVGRLQKLKEFHLEDEEVKKIMKKRYGDKIPLDESVISPGVIFDSELLVKVKEG